MDYWHEHYPYLRHREDPAPYRALPEWMGACALTEGGWLPCAECVEWDSAVGRWVAARECFVPLNRHVDGMGLYDVVEDSYWSCPHAEVFYCDFQWPCFLYADGSRYKSWAEHGEEEQARVVEAAGGLEAFKAAEAEALKKATLDTMDPAFHVKHLKKMAVDEEYKESSEMAAWLASMEDKKRAAGKDWDLKVALPCKYAVRIHWNEKGKQEKVVTYEYKHPFTGRKSKHFHAECWMHEYVDPKTKKAMAPHKCNCLHPGQPGWDDKWLVDPTCVWVYDRYDDWWKYTYSMEVKQWVYDNSRRKEYADRVRSKGEGKPVPSAKPVEAKSKGEAKGSANAGAKGQAKASAKGGKWATPAAGADADDGWHTVARVENTSQGRFATVRK